MEPVEINAGRFYLRALRHDSRLSDLPALREGIPEADEDYIRWRERGWAEGTRLSWAVCEQTEVEMLAEVVADLTAQPSTEATARTAVISGWSRGATVGAAGSSAAAPLAETAAEALAEGRTVVERFIVQALDISTVTQAAV